MKRITIDYDETQGDPGELLDLFSYLENEFNNQGFVATLREEDTPEAQAAVLSEQVDKVLHGCVL